MCVWGGGVLQKCTCMKIVKNMNSLKILFLRHFNREKQQPELSPLYPAAGFHFSNVIPAVSFFKEKFEVSWYEYYKSYKSYKSKLQNVTTVLSLFSESPEQGELYVCFWHDVFWNKATETFPNLYSTVLEVTWPLKANKNKKRLKKNIYILYCNTRW